jgi:NAD(P)-dependent dehydrogenase (short-subunit alcohol dehydrogenase family)
VATMLVTGATKGLGYETARQLIAAGHTVYVSGRDFGRAQQAADELGGIPIQIDVADDASVAASALQVRAEASRLDVLVNNAGIAGSRKAASETTAADMLAVYDTNVFGVVRMMTAYLPLLLESDHARVVNVSSGLGSLAVTNDPERHESGLLLLAYPSSKSAVNMLTSQYAKNYPTMQINAVDPGFTSTDFNQHRGTQTIEQGVEIIVSMALGTGNNTTGAFVDAHGVMPW